MDLKLNIGLESLIPIYLPPESDTAVQKNMVPIMKTKTGDIMVRAMITNNDKGNDN